MKAKFSLFYFLFAVLLFAAEVGIAAYLHDAIIRPYGGDFLVVIMLYCMVKSIIDAKIIKTALCVLIFAYGIEIAQYLKLVNALGLKNCRLVVVVLGSQFSWGDMLAYTLGIASVLVFEQFRLRPQINNI